MSMTRRSRDSEVRVLHPANVAGRLPPHDLDAEAAVLSAILLHREALDRVLDMLKPEHFYSDANGWIYRAAVELSAIGTPVDLRTVASWLRDREQLARIGGPGYIGQIVDATPAVAHVEAHAAIVREKWRLRQLIATCQKVAAEGYGDVGIVQEFIDGAEQEIYQIARTDQRRRHTVAGEVVVQIFKELDLAAQRGERFAGLSTGYDRLDAQIAGMDGGDLYIVAGRPGMAKTSLALNIGANVASPREVGDEQGRPILIAGKGVLVFSLEMPKEQIGKRLICSEARVDLGRMRQGWLQPEDWNRLTEAAKFMQTLPLTIDDTPALTLLELRARARRVKAEKVQPSDRRYSPAELGLVIVDYLQLMKGRDGVSSREQEISEISRGLKEVAKELGVPVIALSQLNRTVESRADRRPMLSDLRESGAIEQDADVVIFIYRESYYREDAPKHLAELIVAKQRNGPPGKAYVRFDNTCTRFDNLRPGEEQDCVGG